MAGFRVSMEAQMGALVNVAVALSLACGSAFAADLPLRPAKPDAGQVAPQETPKAEPNAPTPGQLPSGDLVLPDARLQDSEKLVPENDDTNLLADPRCYHW